MNHYSCNPPVQPGAGELKPGYNHFNGTVTDRVADPDRVMDMIRIQIQLLTLTKIWTQPLTLMDPDITLDLDRGSDPVLLY